jgi:hypothetical protein
MTVEESAARANRAYDLIDYATLKLREDDLEPSKSSPQ